MGKRDFIIVIKHLHSTGKKSNQIKQELYEIYGESSPRLSTVKRWVWQFERGIMSVDDEARPGRPRDVRSPETIEAIRSLVAKCPKISARDIEQDLERIQCSATTARIILREDLDLRKLSARWVPKILKKEEKEKRVELSRANSEQYRGDWDNFFDCLVTCDETIAKFHTLETRTSSAEWRLRGSAPPVRPKIAQNHKTLMASVFWDSEGILPIDVLPVGQANNSEYYCELLEQSKESRREKRARPKLRKLLLLHDDAPVHKLSLSHSKIDELKLKLVNHPPYSPDLAPFYYFLFKDLKNTLSGKSYGTKD